MTFKTHQLGPNSARSAEYNFEGEFHKRIKMFLPKKAQGYVMGAFRDSLKEYLDIKERIVEAGQSSPVVDYWIGVPNQFKCCWQMGEYFAFSFEPTDMLVLTQENATWVNRGPWELVAERL